jgi:GDP-L-fucose synthase
MENIMSNDYIPIFRPKVLITGGFGFVGSAVFDAINQDKYNPNRFASKDFDLRDCYQVEELFKHTRPKIVIHTASRVGGLGAHGGHHAEFLHDNLLINTNIVEACRKYGCKLIAVSSVAAFPGNLSYLTEDKIHESEVHASEFGYALSKRMLDTQIQLYREEYGCNFCCLFPTNIYGPNDNFNLETGHVIPSLIHKFYKAREDEVENVKMWGDGLSLRQFIYVGDFAKIIVGLMDEHDLPDRMICSSDETYSIKQVAKMVATASGWHHGDLIWDKSGQKNGLRVRECDNSRMKEFCSRKNIVLENPRIGLVKTAHWFEDNYESARK